LHLCPAVHGKGTTSEPALSGVEGCRHEPIKTRDLAPDGLTVCCFGFKRQAPIGGLRSTAVTVVAGGRVLFEFTERWRLTSAEPGR